MYFLTDRDPCPGKEPETYVVYCMGMDSRCGTYKAERLNEKNIVLSFTISNIELPPNCSLQSPRKWLICYLTLSGKIAATAMDKELNMRHDVLLVQLGRTKFQLTGSF